MTDRMKKHIVKCMESDWVLALREVWVRLLLLTEVYSFLHSSPAVKVKCKPESRWVHACSSSSAVFPSAPQGQYLPAKSWMSHLSWALMELLHDRQGQKVENQTELWGIKWQRRLEMQSTWARSENQRECRVINQAWSFEMEISCVSSWRLPVSQVTSFTWTIRTWWPVFVWHTHTVWFISFRCSAFYFQTSFLFSTWYVSHQCVLFYSSSFVFPSSASPVCLRCSSVLQ